jgi:Zn-dependent protease with chaperone function
MQEPIGMPPRKDVFAYNSPFAKAKLQRAEYILSTLVKNPSDYQLIISSKTSFGGEAVPPFVYSDKPTMIIYQGAISPNRSDEEIAFMMAHELGHLTLQHMQRMDHQMGELMAGPPLGISGTTFAVFHVKLQEREADMFGLNLYKKSGYSLSFFPHTLQILEYNPNLHFGSNKIFRKELSSLSMKDSHFSMKERFELLVSEAQHMA